MLLYSRPPGARLPFLLEHIALKLQISKTFISPEVSFSSKFIIVMSVVKFLHKLLPIAGYRLQTCAGIGYFHYMCFWLLNDSHDADSIQADCCMT
jgi:hypothetical protein